MNTLKKDIKTGEHVKNLFKEWSESPDKNDPDTLAYLLSQISLSFNIDFSDFPTQNLPENLSWEKFQSALLSFLNSRKPANPEKLSEKVLKLLLIDLQNDLISSALEKILFDQLKFQLFNRKTRSWISPYFQLFQSESLWVLLKYSQKNSLEVQLSSLLSILKDFLILFGIPISEKDVFVFQRMVDNKLKKSKQDSEKLLKYLKISFFETIDLIEDWALKESYKHITVKDQLKVTQTDCESLISSHIGQEISVHLEELAKNLETLQKSLKKPKKNPEQNLEDLQQKGLKDIFEFYSKQTKQIGQFPTFTELNDHQSVLNLSKFTKFCSDFELISTIKDKYKIPLSHLSNIFLKATNCKRIMSFSSFLLSIDYLADDFYSENYDRYFNEKLSILTTELKRKKLLIFLKCNDPKTYSLKLKGFGSAFSLEKKGYRIPDYDLSKKYKFKDQSKVKEKIENWKNQKKEAVVPSRSNSVPSYARIRAIQQSLLTRPDRITWDLLNKNLNFITREDLEKLFEADDIRELIKEGVKVV